MIEFVDGELISKSPSYAVIRAQGVGYRLIISLSTFDDLPPVGDPLRLWSHYQLREDEATLFGFSTLEERWLFQQLISVNGVGPKLAITMLSSARVEAIRHAVANGDSDRLKAIPKIGAKIAERIVLELKKKVQQVSPAGDGAVFSGTGSAVEQSIEALVALGFSHLEAERAVERARSKGASAVEELVKHSLRGS